MDIVINKFKDCIQCGACCSNAPCDLIPEDLPALLDYFNMGLEDFFSKYLIALPVVSPFKPDVIFMMVPVKVDSEGKRLHKYLADIEYLNYKGKCIFSSDNKCNINEIKPFGGKIMKCPNMTGSGSIQFSKSIYFTYWYNNQHLFKQIFSTRSDLFDALREIYVDAQNEFDKANSIMPIDPKNFIEYDKLKNIADNLITKDVFACFNNSIPIQGWKKLF